MNFLHDYYNIVTLPILVWCNLLHMQACYDAPRDPDPLTMFSLTRISNSWTFDLIWWVFLFYIGVDTLWLLIFPRSVVAPVPILIHHAILLAAWFTIFFWPGYEFYMSASLLIEINTWFLIAKRQAVRGSILHTLLLCGDHVSWMVVRVLGLPCMNFNGYCIWRFLTNSFHSKLGYNLLNHLNSGLFVFAAGSAITVQNAFWTRDKYLKVEIEITSVSKKL